MLVVGFEGIITHDVCCCLIDGAMNKNEGTVFLAHIMWNDEVLLEVDRTIETSSSRLGRILE
jgi:hypothetical protein